MKMKSIKYISLAIAISVTSVSCKKKFLEEDMRSNIPTEDFYKTPDDADKAVNSAYQLLNYGGNTVQTPYNTLFNTGLNFMADDEFPGPGATNGDVRSMANLLHTSTNLRVYELWQQHYAAIKKANLAVIQIPKIVFPAATLATQARLIAEAKFLRALWYFNLVRLYGDVPLITENTLGVNGPGTYYDGVKPQDFYIERTPSAAVYAQIEQDLKDAAAVLPNNYTGTSIGRATKGAALAVLSKVYLTKAPLPLNIQQHYRDAIDYAELALSPAEGGTGTFGYALFANYADVFLPASKNKQEHIFSAQFLKATSSTEFTQGNNQNPRSIRANVPGLAGSYADQVWYYKKDADTYYSIFKIYRPGDKRRDVSFVTTFRSPTNGKLYGEKLPNVTTATKKTDSVAYFNKTWDPSSASNPSGSAANVAIIRYAELLLIHAEAENELNGATAKAYASLNKVRTRAGLPNLTAGLSKDQFRDSLYLDRRLELVFEYHRWFDLVRQKDASGNSIFVKSLQEAGKINANDRHRLHPIPQTEMDVNPKLGYQNPGY